MNLWPIYHKNIPEFIRIISQTTALQRLKGVGMNCGCEYTGFSGFRSIGAYTRFEHSIGTALIVWHFTNDKKQSTAALLHDIATPAFAHVIDFLHGDHVRQESTEDRTLEIIRNSEQLVTMLSEEGVSPEDVSDYHLFPIADNDTPKLSSDRLEYTLGNLVNFHFGTEDTAKELFDDLCTGTNETGEPEIMFRNRETASRFARLSLKCSKVYSSDEDRYAMQMLAELIREWIDVKLITEEDLYTTENHLLDKISADSYAWEKWLRFRSISKIFKGVQGPDARIIQAKKRHIDPYVSGIGRVSSFDNDYNMELNDYLAWSFTYTISI